MVNLRGFSRANFLRHSLAKIIKAFGGLGILPPFPRFSVLATAIIFSLIAVDVPSVALPFDVLCSAADVREEATSSDAGLTEIGNKVTRMRTILIIDFPQMK